MAARVVVERVLPGTPAEVYVAWTDPAVLRTFLCPGETSVAALDADVRVGGRFRVVMRDGDRDVVHTGEYRILEPPRRLAFTWTSPITGSQPTLVTIELSPHEDGTRLVLVHESLPTDDAASRHRRGWTSIVDKLGDRLSRDRLARA